MIDICDCDVENKETLAIFRIKRRDWISWLLEDSLSISNQIQNMLLRDTIFRTFNEARRLTINKKSNTLGFNGLLLRLIDESFVDSQIMAIRRLTDPNFYDPKKAVISLPRLINDLSANEDVFTRENYVSYDGSKYEGLSFENDDIEDCVHGETKHKKFDKLSNVPPQDRSRDDKIIKSVFKKLNNELKICEELRTYANKFIAHASDPIGRVNLTENEKRITLDKFDKCYKAIISVSSFISTEILYKYTLGGVPTPQGNHLENLEIPMVAKDDLTILYDYWRDRGKEVDLWSQDPYTIV